MDESVSFGTLGATGHGVTEHLNVPVCGMSYCADTNYCFVAMETASRVSRVVLLQKTDPIQKCQVLNTK